MDVSLTVYKTMGGHKLTVVARPARSSLLGEAVLVEGMPLTDLGDDPSAQQVLVSAYRAIAGVIAARALG